MFLLGILLTFAITISIFSIIYIVVKNYKENGIKLRKKFKGKHVKAKKLLAIALIILILGGISFLCFNISFRVAYLRIISGKSEWRESNGQSYLYVEADTNYDLGYQTGMALANQIVMMKTIIIASGISLGISYLEIEQLSREYLPHIPDKYQEELNGICDGAIAGTGIPLSFSDILIQAVFFDVIYGRYNPSLLAPYGCTAFGVKNLDNSTIIGQNIDLVKPMEWVQSFVLHKLRNKPLVFTYRLGGCPALGIGKNEHGLAIVMNLVQTKVKAPLTTPLFVLIREGFECNNNLEDFYNLLFKENNSPFSFNAILTDNRNIIAVQALPQNQTKIYAESLMVHTNTYYNPFWQDKLVDSTYSKERQNYAENIIANKIQDRQLSETELLNILGEKPIICRNEEGIFGMKTVAFLTLKSFGKGTPNENIGVVPI